MLEIFGRIKVSQCLLSIQNRNGMCDRLNKRHDFALAAVDISAQIRLNTQTIES